MSCNDDGWTQFRMWFENLHPIAHTNVYTYVHMYSTQLASQERRYSRSRATSQGRSHQENCRQNDYGGGLGLTYA